MNTSRTITGPGSTPSMSHLNTSITTGQAVPVAEADGPVSAPTIMARASTAPPLMTSANTASAADAPASLTDQDKFLGKPLDVPPAIVGLGRFFDQHVQREFVGAVNELRADAKKVGRQHCPEVATWGEALVKSGWAVAANRDLRKSYSKIKATVADMALTETAQKQKITKLRQWPATAVTGCGGECMIIAQAETAHQVAVNAVQVERTNKSLRHETISGGLKKLIKFFILTDLIVIYLFLSNVLNVNVNDPMRTLFPFITAVFLSLLGTAAYGVGLHWMGANLRHWKDSDRSITLPTSRSARRIPIAMLAGMIALPLLVGVLMTYRIWHDSSEAAASLAGGAITAVFMAIMVCVLGLMVGFSAFLDGSVETDTIHNLGPKIRSARETKQTLIAGIISDADRAQELRNDVDTAVLEAIVAASDKISGADQVIMAARSYLQTTGPIAVTLTNTIDRIDVAGFLEPHISAELRDLRNAQQRANAIAERTAASAKTQADALEGATPTAEADRVSAEANVQAIEGVPDTHQSEPISDNFAA